VHERNWYTYLQFVEVVRVIRWKPSDVEGFLIDTVNYCCHCLGPWVMSIVETEVGQA
jgi:hypothetical protein